ncbi:peptidase inhibitor family I36 protein [Kitasatospora sp. NPDC057904]|uniref:peptidase inhibitor family I36 protein n=1 Tax=unclassified Kitasatospora TaxID=2633591 RepID=UPI0036D9DE16
MGAAERFTEELRKLYEAAGAPTYRQLADQGMRQQPQVKVGVATLCDWLNGRSIPSDAKVARFVVEVLEARAQRRGAAAKRGWAYWEELRRAAIDERRKPSQPPRPPGPGDDAGRSRLSRRGRLGLLAGAVLAVAGAATVAVLVFLPSGREPAPSDSGSAVPGAPPVPAIADAHGGRAVVDVPSGPGRFYVAHEVQGPDACPRNWVCLFENQSFNERPGWMLLADASGPYDLDAAHDKAASSVVNNTAVDVALHVEHSFLSPYVHADPYTRITDLRAPDKGTPSLVNILTDGHAWTPGTLP